MGLPTWAWALGLAGLGVASAANVQVINTGEVRKCGAVHWAPDGGFRSFEFGNFGLFVRTDANEKKYADDAGCKCATICSQTAGCQRWVLKPRYKATVSLLKNQCDDPSLDRDKCGFESTCFLRREIPLPYDRTVERSASEGYIGTITGTRACPIGTSACLQSTCCDLRSNICHNELGCVSKPANAAKISDSFADTMWVIIPIVLASVLMIIAIFHKVVVYLLVAHAERVPAPMDYAMATFLTDAAQWVFILTEFVLAFWVLTQVNDKYARVSVGQMEGCKLCDYTETTGIEYRYAAMVDRGILEGREFPQIFNHLGKYYAVFGFVYEPFWQTWFQVILYIFLPIQMLMRAVILFHKSFLWWKFAQGVDLTGYVWFYIVVIELFGHLEPGFLVEPVHRAWNAKLFCSWGMMGAYIFVVVVYFFSQAMYVLASFYKYRRGKIDPVTMKMGITHTVRHKIMRLMSFYTYPLFFCLMVILGLIYKTTTPPGPPTFRVWFFFIGPVVCKLVGLCLIPLNLRIRAIHNERTQGKKNAQKFQQIGPNPMGSFSATTPTNAMSSNPSKQPRY